MEKEKKTKKKWNFMAVWLVLAILSFLILASLVFGHINEWSAMKFGQTIEAQYHEDESGIYATYQDEEGTEYTFDLMSYYPVHDGEKINLYYLTSISEAQPANTLVSWLKDYVIFGAVFGFSMWRLQKNNPKNIYK